MPVALGSAILTANNAAPHAKSIQITERALVKIRSAMEKEGVSSAHGGLRLEIQGGGCSGLNYHVCFDAQPQRRDRIYEFDGVRLLVDPKSFIYLYGMILDYDQSLVKQGSYFIILNPNSTKPCGCGSSFPA